MAIRRSFKSFGKKSIVFPPGRFDNPHRIEIGSRVQIREGCWLNVVEEWAGKKSDGLLTIGNDSCVMYGSQISVSSRVEIGQNVGIGQNSVITDHLHDYSVMGQSILSAPITEAKPVLIEDETFVGVNCVIAPGVTIGRHSFIGSNSVVIGDIPPFTMAAGNPAKIIRAFNSTTRQWEKRT